MILLYFPPDFPSVFFIFLVFFFQVEEHENKALEVTVRGLDGVLRTLTITPRKGWGGQVRSLRPHALVA
jgi:hypothetical protein